jgi:hypothetical protein
MKLFPIDYLEEIIQNYLSLLTAICEYSYIDQIKIIMTFTEYYVFYSKTRFIYGIEMKLVKLNKIDENYLCFKNGFNLFYKIIDNFNENSEIYNNLLQINSFIGYDLILKHHTFGGSILSPNDIKLELIKNLNQFVFVLNLPKGDFKAEYSKNTKVVTFNLAEIFNKPPKNIEKSNNIDSKNFSIIILFIFFHELFGHKKKDILNTFKNSPRYIYSFKKNDFVHIDAFDTGYIFEFISFNKIRPLIKIQGNENLKKLYNVNYYIGDSFDKLNEKIYEIEKEEIKKIYGNDYINKSSYFNLNDEDEDDYLTYEELSYKYLNVPAEWENDRNGYFKSIKNKKGFIRLKRIVKECEKENKKI